MMIKYLFKSSKIVLREDFILSQASGKSVLHLGATDAPFTADSFHSRRLLHSKIDSVCSDLVGLDLDKPAIDFLHNCGITNIIHGSAETSADYPMGDFEIIVAGEILEHLPCPGNFFKALSEFIIKNNISPKIIITVPNAFSMKAFFRAVFGYELVHSDHIQTYTQYTLINSLRSRSFVAIDHFFFNHTSDRFSSKFINKLLRFFPQLSDGLGVVCEMKTQHA